MTNKIKHAALFDGHVTLLEYANEFVLSNHKDECFSVLNSIKRALRPFHANIRNVSEIHKGKLMWKTPIGHFVLDMDERPPVPGEVVGRIDEGTDIEMNVVSKHEIKQNLRFNALVDGKTKNMYMYWSEFLLIGRLYHTKMTVTQDA